MKIAFSTSSLLRKEKYKIITTVYVTRGKLFVKKSAASKFSISHINTIAKSEEIIKKALSYLNFVKVVSKKRGTINYEYINLPTFSQLIEKALIAKNFDYALNLVREGLEIIDKATSILANPYESIKFTSLFDPDKIYIPQNPEECISLGILDIKFDNLLNDGKEVYLIDYEWVYNFAISKKYLKFRAVFYLINSLQFIIDTLCSVNFPCYRLKTDLLIPKGWYNLIPLNKSELRRFFNYEINFQNHVNLIQSTFIPESIIEPKEVVKSSQIEDLNSASESGKSSDNKTVLKVFLLENEIARLKKQLSSTNDELESIKASKFFKLWQKYVKLKNLGTKNIFLNPLHPDKV